MWMTWRSATFEVWMNDSAVYDFWSVGDWFGTSDLWRVGDWFSTSDFWSVGEWLGSQQLLKSGWMIQQSVTYEMCVNDSSVSDLWSVGDSAVSNFWMWATDSAVSGFWSVCEWFISQWLIKCGWMIQQSVTYEVWVNESVTFEMWMHDLAVNDFCTVWVNDLVFELQWEWMTWQQSVTLKCEWIVWQ